MAIESPSRVINFKVLTSVFNVSTSVFSVVSVKPLKLSPDVNSTSDNSTAIGYGSVSTSSNEIVLGIQKVKTSGKIYTSGVLYCY